MARQSQVSLAEYDELLEFLKFGTYPRRYNLNFTTRQGFSRRVRDFSLNEENQICKTVDGLLKVVVCSDDEEKINNLIQSIHEESGHKGRDEVFRRISESYIGMSKTKVAEVILGCYSCNRHAPLSSNPGIIPIRAFFPFERIQLDMVDLKEYEDFNDGYKFILNVIDCFSKYVFSVPLRQKSADAVYDFLQDLFLNEGYPYIIHTDNGREFKNSKVESLCVENNIKFIHGRPRRPQSQGQIERANQTITKSIVKTCFQSQVWYKSLKNVVSNYNKSFHRAIGAIPFEIFRGRKFLNNNADIIQRINLSRDHDSPSLFDDENIPGFIYESSEILSEPANGNFIQESAVDNVESDAGLQLFDQFLGNLTEIQLQELISEQQSLKRDFDNFLESQSQTHNNVISSNEKYYEKMVRSTSVHSKKRDLKVNDKVLIAEDFDTNQKTRKRFFSENFSKQGIVLGHTKNGLVRVKLELTNEIRNFKVNMLKLNQ